VRHGFAFLEAQAVKIFVAGGAGFIGRYFHALLTEAGHDIVIYDLVKPKFDVGRARFVQGDVRDARALRAALQGREAILNLAAAHHDFGIAEPTYYDVNENGSRILCDAADALGIRDICFYSSVAVFGDAPEPRREDSPTAPNSPYGGSKLAGEKVYREWTSRGDGRQCLVIRPTVTFGPHNFANMYSLIRQIYSGKYMPVGNGSNIKSLSYVENIVACTMFLWAKKDRGPFEIFQYIDKPDLTSHEIAAQIYESLGRKVPSMHLPLGVACALALPFDLIIKLTGKNLPVSSARIKKLFATQTKFEADRVQASGFKAPYTLRQGLDKMVKWYLAEGRHKKAVWNLPPARVETHEPAQSNVAAA
jgi:nucleoside-diphosphate-sugar epimerase